MVRDACEHGRLLACATIAPVKVLLIGVVRSGGGRSQDPAASRRGLVAAPIALKHEAHRRIRIGAEVLAGGVEHVVLRVGAVSLLRKRARSGAGDQYESNGGSREPGCLLSWVD